MAKLEVKQPRFYKFEKLTRKWLTNQLELIAHGIKTDYEKTFETWANKPEVIIKRRAGVREVIVDDTIYSFVDKGTKPHIIRPKRARLLRFGVGGTPKTTPRIIGSVNGRVGNQLVFARQVRHPGTKPRDFTKMIGEKWKRSAKTQLLLAITKQLK
jgi:hypothetical protein